MVVTDALSKWPEIFVMENTSAEDTVSTLRSLFARMGLPDQIVSDNGPQFTSKTLQQKFDRFLLTYRSVPHATTALSPAQLLLGRNIRTRLDLIKPDVTGGGSTRTCSSRTTAP